MVKRVPLAAKLDTAASAELRETLISAGDEDIVLEAGAVEMLGGACVELLLTASVLWRKAGQAMTLENVSPQMADDLGRFGLTPETLLEFAE
jgi:chemotaxis protein CheX